MTNHREEEEEDSEKAEMDMDMMIMKIGDKIKKEARERGLDESTASRETSMWAREF